MSDQDFKPIIFQGKEFIYHFHYAGYPIYQNGDTRLMIRDDGSIKGLYQFNSKKSFRHL